MSVDRENEAEKLPPGLKVMLTIGIAAWFVWFAVATLSGCSSRPTPVDDDNDSNIPWNTPADWEMDSGKNK